MGSFQFLPKNISTIYILLTIKMKSYICILHTNSVEFTNLVIKLNLLATLALKYSLLHFVLCETLTNMQCNNE